MIVASPSFRAVTTPSSETVATFSSDDVQVTLLSEASSGVTVAVNVVSVPFAMDISVGSIVMPVADIITLTMHSAELFPQVAVMIAFPFPMAVTIPSFTVATLSSLDDQMILSVVSSGSMNAVNVSCVPFSRVISDLSRVIPDAGFVTVTVHVAVFPL